MGSNEKISAIEACYHKMIANIDINQVKEKI